MAYPAPQDEQLPSNVVPRVGKAAKTSRSSDLGVNPALEGAFQLVS